VGGARGLALPGVPHVQKMTLNILGAGRLIGFKEFYQMFKWFTEEGYRADLARLRRDYPGAQITPLEKWLEHEGWANKGTRYSSHEKSFYATIPKAN
jgi:hypothetical protein